MKEKKRKKTHGKMKRSVWIKRSLGLCLMATLTLGLLAGCGNRGNGGTQNNQGGGTASKDTIKIGYVNPTTGTLSGNGEGAEWVIKQIETYVNDTKGGVTVDGSQAMIDVIMYDSTSDQSTASEMAQKLVEEDEVDLLVAIQTPETVIPVAAVAERYGVPCVAIQAPVNAVAGAYEEYESTYHAFWTIEKVYEQYKALWAQAGYGPDSKAVVGLAFANDADGTAWHDVFVELAAADGYQVVDPGQYPSGTTDFTNIVNAFKSANIDILAGTNIPPDFLNLFNEVIKQGVSVGCITMGKCCLLEGDVAALGDLAEGIMTEVWWAPTNPYTSNLTGVSCDDLGTAYASDNGRNMPQPAGYAYAALEIAVNAFEKAGSTNSEAVLDALSQTDIQTIVGPIKYDQKMGGLTYGDTVISGGQWQKNADGNLELVIIDNTVYPEVPTTGSYAPGNATNQ